MAERLACSPAPACIGRTVRAAPSSSPDRLAPMALLHAVGNASHGRPTSAVSTPIFLARKPKQGRTEQQRRWQSVLRLGSIMAVSSDVLAVNKAAPAMQCTGTQMMPVFVWSLDPDVATRARLHLLLLHSDRHEVRHLEQARSANQQNHPRNGIFLKLKQVFSTVNIGDFSLSSR